MTKDHFKAGIIQLNTGLRVAENKKAANRLIREAASAGCSYILTPETTLLMEEDTDRLLANIHPDTPNNEHVAFFSAIASELGIWLHIGSIAIRLENNKVANRSYLFNPHGETVATYNKIHLFDVEVSKEETYRESASYEGGHKAVLSQLPWGKLGMSICYDLRFPALYRSLAQAGGSFLSIPAAFTKVTGEAHWHPLLRARAIETSCFVFASAQAGLHENGRETYGHSMIIDPWGRILAEADGETPGYITADIDTNLLADIRKRLPSLAHDREYSF